MALAINDLNVPHRLLLGPGPSAVHPRVLRTMSTALVGYLDPEWLSLMDEEQTLLRGVFQTNNTLTFPMSGTGSAGMETAFCNFVEPGDTVVIGCNGYFSERYAIPAVSEKISLLPSRSSLLVYSGFLPHRIEQFKGNVWHSQSTI